MSTDLNIFTPFLCNITDITNAQNAVITFSEDHDFTVGEIISIRCSKPYGMKEINNMSTRVIDVTSDTVTTEIDTSNFTPFVYPPVGTVVYPCIAVPSASGIIPDLYPSTVNLEDAFDNEPVA